MQAQRASSASARWLLLSDIHFRAHDLHRSVQTAEWIVRLAKQHKVRRVVVCGDVLTTRSMQPISVLSACYRFLGQLSDVVPHVNVLLGNHDLAYRNDYTTSALEGLRGNRLAPFVTLHSDLSCAEWDGRRVLVLPFRDDQTELTRAAASLGEAEAAETVAFAHLAIHRAVTQRHVVRAPTGDTASPVTYRGFTGLGNFSGLARTFTGHFHSHQTMIQPARQALPLEDEDRLRGSLTYIGSPLQLTWADLLDDQRGVMLLDPATLHHELVVNPHAVAYTTVDVGDAMRDALDPAAVADKHVMLLGNLTRFSYLAARDKLLAAGARSVRNWSPATPVLQDSPSFTGLGMTAPASDREARGPQHLRQESALPDEPGTSVEGGSGTESGSIEVPVSGDEAAPDRETVSRTEMDKPAEPMQVPPIEQVDLDYHVRNYAEALDLGEQLGSRQEQLVHVGQRIIRVAARATEDETPSYLTLLDTQPISGAADPAATTRHIFVARPRSLTISNFLGVQDKVEIDFSRDVQTGLTYIVGSNGSGKSTLFEAIVWCQFGRCLRAGLAVNDVVNDITRKNCSVSLAFDNGYSITRYRKDKEFGNRVIVSLHGEVQPQFERADVRGTQEALDELLGIDYDTFVRTIVLGNEGATGFMSSTPLQRRELIEMWLGLSALDDYAQLARQMVKEVDTDAGEVRNMLAGHARNMDLVQNRIFDLQQRRSRLEMALFVDAKEDQKASGQKDADSLNAAMQDLQVQIQEARGVWDDLSAQARSAEIRNAVGSRHGQLGNAIYQNEQRLVNIETTMKTTMQQLSDAQTDMPQDQQGRSVSVTKAMLGYIHRCLEACVYKTEPGDEVLRAPTHGKLGSLVTQHMIRACLVGLEVAIRVLEGMGTQMLAQDAKLVRRQHEAAQLIEDVRKDIIDTEQRLADSRRLAAHVEEDIAKEFDVDVAEVRQVTADMSAQDAANMTSRSSRAMADLTKLLNQEASMRRRIEDQQDAERRRAEDAAKRQQDAAARRAEAATYATMLEQETATLERLREEQGAPQAHLEALSSARELFSFWESAFGKGRGGGRTTAGRVAVGHSSTFRAYVLDRSLDELNELLSQMVAVLYEETRHDFGRGMLQSLLVEGEGEQEDDATSADADEGADHEGAGEETKARWSAARGPGGQARVMDQTLGIHPALGYAKRSGGERKRLDLAVFFALLRLGLQSRSPHRARYLLVDEAFDGLDAAGRAAVARWCRDGLVRATGAMDFVLVATHRRRVVGRGADEDLASDSEEEEAAAAVEMGPGVVRALIGERGETRFDVGGAGV